MDLIFYLFETYTVVQIYKSIEVKALVAMIFVF